MSVTGENITMQVLDSREACGMTDGWAQYLCIEKVRGGYKLFVGGIPPRCRKIRQDDSCGAVVFGYGDDTAIQNWLDENRWRSKCSVTSVKKAIKGMADTK